jgi:alcohol dehydrogenase class IV
VSAYFTSPRIVSGVAALDQLTALRARRAFLLVDPAVRAQGGDRRAIGALEDSGTRTESAPTPRIEPTIDSVETLVAPADAFDPDWIVALGGGSTIDTAKALWVRLENPTLSLRDVHPLAEVQLRRRARLAAIPTTSGSGSEATWVAHLHDGPGRLLEIGTRDLMPDWALLDSEFARGMPAEVAGRSGADALAHALETLASVWATPLARAPAREAVRLLARDFPRLARRRDDPELGESVHAAAMMAGLAVANAQVGVAHALAHALAGAFDLPHGLAVATLLPYSLEFNFPAARDDYESLGEILGAAAVQNRNAFADRVRAILAPWGLPRTLEEAGLPPGALAEKGPALAAAAHASPGAVANPRVPSREDLERLLGAARDGRRVDF